MLLQLKQKPKRPSSSSSKCSTIVNGCTARWPTRAPNSSRPASVLSQNQRPRNVGRARDDFFKMGDFGRFWEIAHVRPYGYSLVKEHPPQVTGALRARVTIGA